MSVSERKRRGPSHRRAIAVSIMLAAVAIAAVTTAAVDDGRRAGTADGVSAVGMVVTDTITPAMIALGERIYQGKAAGAICATCHGKDARGLAGLGPDLTDGTWLHGDGSVKFLENIIRTGVMQPKQGAAVMPPYGGVPLDGGQLAAVAAYVYSLSHQAGGPGNGHP